MFSWFNTEGRGDSGLLEKWRRSPSNFNPNQPIDSTWNVEGYKLQLGVSRHSGEEIFQAASRLLLQYRFFPDSVLRATTAFGQDGREMRPGDLIVQRIRLIPRALDILTANRVQYLTYERYRKGFTVYTTENHIETGEWTAVVSLKPDGEVILTSHVIVKSGPQLPVWALPFARMYHKRAHRLGRENISRLLKGHN